MRGSVGDQQAAAPTIFVEYTAALGLVVLAVVAFAMWRPACASRGWFWTLAIFAALSLGPVRPRRRRQHATCPGRGRCCATCRSSSLTRMPTRFAIVAALGAQRAVRAGPRRDRRALAASRRHVLAGVAPCCSPSSCGRRHARSIPRRSRRSTTRARRPAAGAHPRTALRRPRRRRRPKATSAPATSSTRRAHDKRLIGGYLSRVSSRRFREVRESPMLIGAAGAERGPHARRRRDRARSSRDAPAFVERARLGWVVIHPSQHAAGARRPSPCARSPSNASPRTATPCSTARASTRRPRPPSRRPRRPLTRRRPTAGAGGGLLHFHADVPRAGSCWCTPLSGAAALVYEVAWTRLLTLYLGHGVAAASTVLAAFMGGLAIGAAVAGPAQRPRSRAGARCASTPASKSAIAVLALRVPFGLAALEPLLRRAYADGAGGLAFPVLRLLVERGVRRAAGRGDGRDLPARGPLVRARRRGGHPRRRRALRRQHGRRGRSARSLTGFVLLPALGLRLTTWPRASR